MKPEVQDAALPAVQVAYAIDADYATPCAISIHSMLSHASGPVRLCILHHGFSDQHFDLIRATVGLFPDSEVRFHPLDDDMFDLRFAQSYVTPATFGRLRLPDILEGRVVYLDADTLVLGDIRQIATVDLGDTLAAVVRDFGIVERYARLNRPDPKPGRTLRRLRREAEASIALLEREVGPERARDYFNAGVMVLDCDAIGADPDLAAAFRDTRRAAAYRFLDQDLLNVVLGGRVTHVDSAWNTFWGNPWTNRFPFDGPMQQIYTASSGRPQIIHFVGKYKPWQKFRLSYLHRGFVRWFVNYRLAAFRYRRDLANHGSRNGTRARTMDLHVSP